MDKKTRTPLKLFVGGIAVMACAAALLAPLDTLDAQGAEQLRVGGMALSCYARSRVGSLGGESPLDLASVAQGLLDRCLDDESGSRCDLGMIWDPVDLEAQPSLRTFQRQLARMAARLDRSRAERRRVVRALGRFVAQCDLEEPAGELLDQFEGALEDYENETAYHACRAVACLPAEAEPHVWAVALLPETSCYEGCPGDDADPVVALIARRLGAANLVPPREALTTDELHEHVQHLRRVTTRGEDDYERFD